MADAAPLELLPEATKLAKPLFAKEEDYDKFREDFIETVTPELEKWAEARRKSEEEARQRLLR